MSVSAAVRNAVAKNPGHVKRVSRYIISNANSPGNSTLTNAAVLSDACMGAMGNPTDYPANTVLMALKAMVDEIQA